MSGTTKPDAIEKLAGLNAQEDARLQTLISDLASDPAQTVRQLQAQESRINAMIEQVSKLTTAAFDQNRTTLRGAHRRLATARAAAVAASVDLFAAEPLPDIGSDIWRVLWEAARTYSREAAYPEKPFPMTDPDAHCVLCQQPLSVEAADWLRSFEAFVQDESNRREKEAAAAYDELLEQLSPQSFLMKELPSFVALIRDDIGHDDIGHDDWRRPFAARLSNCPGGYGQCFEPTPARFCPRCRRV